jgi:hypothetical protein
LDGREVVQLIAVARPNQEVGQVVGLYVYGIRRLGLGGAAELAAIEILAELGVEVGDSHIEVAVFASHLEAVAAFQNAVVDLGICIVGVGELGISCLPAEL